MTTAPDLFAVLGEPTRLRIIMLLLERELCVCDLTDVLNLPQSTVSRHMARLKSIDLVSSRRDLTWIHYRLKQSTLTTGLKTFLRSRSSNTEPYRSDRKTLTTLLREGRCASARR